MKNLFFLCLFIALTTSCNRWEHQYPEDEKRTKLSPTERLQNKTWHFAFASVNGVDYTDSVKAITGECGFELNSNLFGTGGPSDARIGNYFSSNFPSGSLIWGFRTNEILSITSFGSSSGIPSQYPNYLIFPLHGSVIIEENTIVKLNEVEMKVIRSKGDSTIINIYKS